MICQIGEDGLEHVIAYASRLLKNNELNWSVTDKECFAVIFLVKKFRIYLYGRHFELFTDHWALVFLMTSREFTGRHARWVLVLQEYKFKINYKKGEQHINADAVSRPVLSLVINTRDSDATWKAEDPYDNAELMYYLKNRKHIEKITNSKRKKVNRLLKHYKLENNKLYYRKGEFDEKWLEVPTLDERAEIIALEHERGHWQQPTVYAGLRNRYFWPKMNKDIGYIIKTCMPCQRNTNFNPVHHPAKVNFVTEFNEQICMDIVGGLPVTEEGFCYILTIVEFSTGHVSFYCLKSKQQQKLQKHYGHTYACSAPRNVFSRIREKNS